MTSHSPPQAGNSDFSTFGESFTIVPDVCDKGNEDTIVENESPRGGKITFDLTLPQTSVMNTDISKICNFNTIMTVFWTRLTFDLTLKRDKLQHYKYRNKYKE